MTYEPKLIPSLPIGVNADALERNYPIWATKAKSWNKLDRFYSCETQLISLAEVTEKSEFLSSDILLNPSIPEFTLICREEISGPNSYIAYRKTILTERDIWVEQTPEVSQTVIPVIDAYLHLNNGGTLCNMVLTICKSILKIEGREFTTTTQFISYIHDDPVSHAYAEYDAQYVFEFNRSIKLMYLAVQMLSTERPEILRYGKNHYTECISRQKEENQ